MADSKGFYATVDGKFSTVTMTGSVIPNETIQGFPQGLSLGTGKLYFVSQGKLQSLATGAPAAIPINFSAQMSVNLREEEVALFNEIWWAMDRMYYDPKFHGKDWAGIKAKFAKVVPYASDRSDFYAA